MSGSERDWALVPSHEGPRAGAAQARWGLSPAGSGGSGFRSPDRPWVVQPEGSAAASPGAEAEVRRRRGRMWAVRSLKTAYPKPPSPVGVPRARATPGRRFSPFERLGSVCYAMPLARVLSPGPCCALCCGLPPLGGAARRRGQNTAGFFVKPSAFEVGGFCGFYVEPRSSCLRNSNEF